jgi:hypothetical protein
MKKGSKPPKNWQFENFSYVIIRRGPRPPPPPDVFIEPRFHEFQEDALEMANVPPQILEAARAVELSEGGGAVDTGPPLLRPEEVFPFLTESSESAAAAAADAAEDAAADRAMGDSQVAAAGGSGIPRESAADVGEGPAVDTASGSGAAPAISRESGEEGKGGAQISWSEAAIFLDEYLASVEQMGPEAGGVTSLRMQLQRQGVIPKTSAAASGAQPGRAEVRKRAGPKAATAGDASAAAENVTAAEASTATDPPAAVTGAGLGDCANGGLGTGEMSGEGRHGPEYHNVLPESGMRQALQASDASESGTRGSGQTGSNEGTGQAAERHDGRAASGAHATSSAASGSQVHRSAAHGSGVQAASRAADGRERAEKCDRLHTPLEMHLGRPRDMARARLPRAEEERSGEEPGGDSEDEREGGGGEAEELWLRGRDWQKRDAEGVARARAAAAVWSRVLRRPLKRGRHVVLDLCVASPDQRSGALERHIIAWSDRHRPWLGPAAYRLARRLSVGDLWPTVYHKNLRVRRWS